MFSVLILCCSSFEIVSSLKFKRRDQLPIRLLQSLQELYYLSSLIHVVHLRNRYYPLLPAHSDAFRAPSTVISILGRHRLTPLGGESSIGIDLCILFASLGPLDLVDSWASFSLVGSKAFITARLRLLGHALLTALSSCSTLRTGITHYQGISFRVTTMIRMLFIPPCAL